MGKGIRGKLSKRDVALFKLVLWCVLIVWSAFFFTLSVSISRMAKASAIIWWPGELGKFMEWSLPIFIVFTSLLIIYGILRWAKRKLQPSIKLKEQDAKLAGKEDIK